MANVALHHAEELARFYRVSLFSDGFPVQPIAGVTFCRLPSVRFCWLRRLAHVPNELSFALAARRELIKKHQQSPINLIMCHGHPVARITCAPMRRRYQIPYALVIHGDIFDRPQGTYDPRLTWFYRKVTPGAYRSADLIIALSPHMREMALCSGADPARIKVIPNGIDPAEIGINDKTVAWQTARNGERLELLYVGRLAIEKGIDVLIEACRLLVQSRIDYRLRIVGSGPMEEHLRELVHNCGLDNKIEFLGGKSRSEMGALYRSAQLVCVPSRSDPLPTVVLESMVAGVAVVGAETGGIPFMIEHETTGLVCPAEDIVALAATLGRFASEEGLARRMGEAGRERAARKFNWPEIAVLIVNAIKELKI